MVTVRTDGYRRKIFPRYRAIFSPALDDSGNDSRFAENLDTQLKSPGPANSRHYTTSHDTRLVKGIPELLRFLPAILIPIRPEKKSTVEVVDLCRRLPPFIFNNSGFSTETTSNKTSPLKTLLRGFSAVRELTLTGKNQTAYFTMWTRGCFLFSSSSCSTFSFGRKPSGKSIALKLESTTDRTGARSRSRRRMRRQKGRGQKKEDRNRIANDERAID